MPPAADGIPLDAKLAFLRQPGSYPDATWRVVAVETHLSWVFLTDAHAYKLKKPACHDFADFRSIASRRFYCEEEVRLNRRLAPDVYLGTIALSADALGQLYLSPDEGGSVVDWLVKMRRLPAPRMLDYLIAHHAVCARDMSRIARRLAGFYRSCPSLPVSPAAYRAGFSRDIERNLDVLSRPAYRLDAAQVRGLCDAQQAALQQRQALFDRRVRQGRVVEGHGDLRPEHVCIDTRIAIIDCLEFSRDLRSVDPADETGFLALECERLGAPDAAIVLMERFRDFADDRPPAALVHFYQAFRACLRARIAIRHLDEETFRHSAAWRQRAVDYLQLAAHHQASISSDNEPPE